MRTPPHVMPALITPFSSDGEIDDPAHRHNLEALRARGVAGFLIGGSTGQGPYLEPRERYDLVAIARETTDAEEFLLCGIAAETVREAGHQIAEADAAGADAVLAVTPTTLVRGRDHLVAGFFRAVADLSPLPVLLYSVPALTGYALPTDVVLDLASEAQIVGMKDSGGDPDRVPPLDPLLNRGFVLYAGASRAVFASRAHGAFGAITASANYVPDLVADALVDEGAQAQLTELTSAVEQHGAAGTYAAAEASGLHAGVPRAPLRLLDEESRVRISTMMRVWTPDS
jgi:4-hydroxy-2-oxoglutarate aldolase